MDAVEEPVRCQSRVHEICGEFGAKWYDWMRTYSVRLDSHGYGQVECKEMMVLYGPAFGCRRSTFHDTSSI